jgi:hypothetical protein
MDYLRAAIAAMKKWKVDRIISVATLVTSVAALVLVLKRPAPVAPPQTPAQIAANAQSFQQKLAQLDRGSQASPEDSSYQTSSDPAPAETTETSQSPSDLSSQAGGSPAKPTASQVRITSDEVTAALAQAAGAIPAAAGQLAPGSDIGAMPNILDQQVSFDGDVVHGQFLVNIAGKNVWITVSGHMGSKDGYATFEPTEFKVGDLSIPVSLVNPALQQRLSEQRDRLKLPDSVDGIKVQNGQLVLTQK